MIVGSIRRSDEGVIFDVSIKLTPESELLLVGPAGSATSQLPCSLSGLALALKASSYCSLSELALALKASSYSWDRPVQQPASSLCWDRPVQQPASSLCWDRPVQQPASSLCWDRPVQQPASSLVAQELTFQALVIEFPTSSLHMMIGCAS